MSIPRLHVALRSTAVLLCCAGFAQANTWIVDINNGPGANFIQVRDAVVASSPGDVIIVRPGAYADLAYANAVTKGVTIVGQGTVTFWTGWHEVQVTNLPAGETFVAVNLDALTWRLTNCQGSVTVRESRAYWGVIVQQCADTRFQSMRDIVGSLWADGSRVEIASSTVVGRPGASGATCNPWQPAGNGGTGLALTNGAIVHLTRTSVTGGGGGDGPSPGRGGDGVSVGQSQLWIDGGGPATIRGGTGGWADLCASWWDGNCGNGLVINGGAVIRSGIAVLPANLPPGHTGAPGTPLVIQGGTDQVVAPDSPTLEASRLPTAGAGVLFTVDAPPGSVVRLNLGTQAQVLPTPGILVENLLVKTQSYDLGTVPASGIVMKRLKIAPAAGIGDRLYAQAQVVLLPTGEVRRTSSTLVVVR